MKDEFYKRHCLSKTGEGPGGKFNGVSIKYILDEKILEDLEATLPTYEVAVDFTNYLRSIRDIHQVCLAKEVDLEKSKKVLEDVSSKFYHLFMEHNLNMTLKVHIILHHYQSYFEKYGKTMRHTNGEFTESCYSTLRKSEES